MLGSPLPAAAADPPCLGRWHLEPLVAVPASEELLSEELLSEELSAEELSEGSWCRSEHLPRAIDVRIQRGADGRLDLRRVSLADTKGKVWPQAVFAGACVGGDELRAVFLLASGALYHFQAVHRIGPRRQAALPLEDALVRRVGSFTVVE